MGRTYYCPLTALSVTAAANQDIWEIAAGANNKCRLLGWEIGSSATTAEALELRLQRGSASGTGGAAATEVKADDDDGAITAAVETLNTTPGAVTDVLQTFTWEQLGPLGQVYVPEAVITIPEGGFLKLNLQTAPTAFTASGWVCWEEL